MKTNRVLSVICAVAAVPLLVFVYINPTKPEAGQEAGQEERKGTLTTRIISCEWPKTTFNVPLLPLVKKKKNKALLIDTLIKDYKNPLVLADEKPFQRFYINPSRDTTLTCIEGTVLMVPAHAFAFSSSASAVTSTVQLNVKEYYSVADIIMAGLTTSNGHNMLETGGMIYVDAHSSNMWCDLQQGKNIAISFAKNAHKEKNMQLFYGEIKNDAMDWTLESGKEERTICYAPNFEEQPSFTGLQKYLAQNIRYPEGEIANCIWGKVYVGFVIDETGKVTDVNIKRGVSPGLNEEAMRVVRAMPEWKPAKQNGRPVKTRYTLPINFRIEGCGSTPYYSPAQRKADSLARVREQERVEKGAETDVGANDLVNYTFNMAKLGWINCDRFYQTKEKTNFFVSEKNAENSEVRMLFHDIRSVLAPGTVENGHNFYNIPQNKKVTVFAFKRENEKNYMAIAEANTNDQNLELNYIPVTLEELKKAIERMTNNSTALLNYSL